MEAAIVRLDDFGCPCVIPRSEPERLESMARWLLRRHDSAERRGKHRTFDARRSDLVQGLLDYRQPHGGFGPKADVECLVESALAVLGYEAARPPTR